MNARDQQQGPSSGRLIEEFPWHETRLGPREQWSPTLTTLVDVMLHSHQPMFVCWKPELRIIFNDGFGEILGPNRRDAFAEPIEQLWADASPMFNTYVARVLSGQSTWAEDVPFRTWRSDYREDGYFSFSYAPIHEDGAVAGFLCVCIETTEKVRDRQRLLSERNRLHGLFEQSPSFIAISRGPEHVYEFVNGAYEEFVRRPRERLLGRSIAEIYPAVVRVGIVSIMDEVYRTGIPYSARGVRINLSEDYVDPRYERVVNWVAHPYRDPDGAIIGLFSEGFDITQQVRAEEKVRRLTSDLIHVSRVSAMGAMASALAHELNQPLATVTNYAAAAEMVLRRRGADLPPSVVQDFGEAIGAIKAASLRAGEIIRRLRAMIERKRGGTEHVVLKKVVRQALDLALLQLSGERPKLEIAVPDGLAVRGDPIQIQQVLINLVRNAAEAMRDTPAPQLRIEARLERPMVRICVSDTGPGLPPEIAERLFEPFHTTKEEGLGVGLSISRTIVEAHGGSIRAGNAAEGGCSVCFTLPVHDGPPPEGSGVPTGTS